ncbi:IS66-like element accessory protein TnpA [Pseudomonas sp. NPDC098747]|uniref:IS66-like element accessory protein TnpA n=1 Tax=Pseudomonas sp. NPDC098747 TaxID=3364487 RepID=UPI00383B2AF0
MQRQRRSFSKTFKAQVISECAQPGASVAGTAINHKLNANLVHKWIRAQAKKSVALQAAFLPVKLPPSEAPPETPASTIRIEISHPRGSVILNWPTESSADCASFLRGFLQ